MYQRYHPTKELRESISSIPQSAREHRPNLSINMDQKPRLYTMKEIGSAQKEAQVNNNGSETLRFIDEKKEVSVFARPARKSRTSALSFNQNAPSRPVHKRETSIVANSPERKTKVTLAPNTNQLPVLTQRDAILERK